MATTLLGLIVVLSWPLALSAAAWVIAINALAHKDRLSEVVEALTRPSDVEENATRGDVSLRRRNPGAIACGDGGRLQVQFGRTRHTAQNISSAKG